MAITVKVGSTDGGTTAGTGMDYANPQAAWTGIGTTLSDNTVVELYGTAYDAGFTNEFTLASGLGSGAMTMGGFTLTFKAHSSSGFANNANKLTNALRYNTSNGVALKLTSDYSGSGFAIWVNASGSYVQFEGLQISVQNTFVIVCRSFNGDFRFVKNIIEFDSSVSGCFLPGDVGWLVNNTIVDRSSSGNSRIFDGNSSSGFRISANTFVRPSNLTSGGTAIHRNSATNLRLVDNAVYGFSTAFNVNGGSWGTGTDYNSTDNATATGGGNDQTSKTYANQFEDVNSTGGDDYRVKAGADLIGAGTRDQTYTADLDVVGQTRSTTTPTIGAWEVVAGGGGSTDAGGMLLSSRRNRLTIP